MAGLGVVGKLVLAQMRRHPGRVVLTSLSTVAAACIVVWVVSGYDALVGRFGGMGREYVGRYPMLLIPARGEPMIPGRGGGRLPDTVIESIRRDPAVAAVDPVFETAARVGKPGSLPAPRLAGPGDPEGLPPPGPGGPRAPASGPILMGGVASLRSQGRTPTLVGTDSPEPIHTLLRGRWFDPGHPERNEGAITRDSAEALGIDLGDEVEVAAMGRAKAGPRIRIFAVVDQPQRLPGPRFMVGLPPSQATPLQDGPTPHAVYVPSATAARLGGTARASYAGVALKGDADVAGFLARWSDRLARGTPAVEVRTAGSVDEQVDASNTFASVRAQAYSAMGISLLAALFIIFTTLSMGVDERMRQFAMLRAVALGRWHVAAMVGTEAVLLGLVGWGGGLLAGWGLVALMARLRPESVSEGAALGFWCVALSGVCALGGSLAASIVPAWRATAVSPLDAMAPRRSMPSTRRSGLLAALGLALIAVNPVVVFLVPMPDAARYGASAAVGCTAMAVGFVLLAPLVVIVTERALAPVLARLLGLSPRLLALQLTANMGRTVGTTIALTIGLGLFVAMQTWGYSMLAPFTPGDWAPDAMITVAGGVPDAEAEAIRRVPGLAPGRVAPLAVKQVKFAGDPTGSKGRDSATRQDNGTMIGVDPDLALGGDRPLFDFAFVQGTRSDAVARLKAGRACLVPDHFARESGLGLGDRFEVVPPDDPDRPVAYEIAGVVSMPGWHWLTKSIRRGRSAGLMFASDESVRRDFAPGRTATFWGDLDGSRSEDQVRDAIRQIALKKPGNPATAGPRRPGGGAVTLKTAEADRAEVTERADAIIWALSELPLVTLLVTSLGVINTVMSSIRARRWELGVLRSAGLTRSALFRLIVAESLLIGAVACVLSLGFGTMAGYCGTGVTRYVNIRGGQITPLVIPWARLALGFGLAFGLCLVAAVGPASRVGRAELLALLRSGRSAS